MLNADEVQQIRDLLADRPPPQQSNISFLARHWQVWVFLAGAIFGFGGLGFQVKDLADTQSQIIQKQDLSAAQAASTNSRLTRVEAQTEARTAADRRFHEQVWPRLQGKFDDMLQRLSKLEELLRSDRRRRR